MVGAVLGSLGSARFESGLKELPCTKSAAVTQC